MLEGNKYLMEGANQKCEKYYFAKNLCSSFLTNFLQIFTKKAYY